ncbi:MAG: hypothetical protein U1D30_00245 [Planctomycetota bacterium]
MESISLSEEVSDAQQDAAPNPLTAEFLVEIGRYEREGEAVFESTARRWRAVAKCDDETQTLADLLRDLVQIASADGRPHDDAVAPSRPFLDAGNPAGELSMLTAEFLDPDCRLPFRRWSGGRGCFSMANGSGGIVRHVDDTGDLKIEFRKTTRPWEFNPTADLVRPAGLETSELSSRNRVSSMLADERIGGVDYCLAARPFLIGPAGFLVKRSNELRGARERVRKLRQPAFRRRNRDLQRPLARWLL